MVKFTNRSYGLPTEDQRVRAMQMRRPLKSKGEYLTDFFADTTVVGSMLLGSVAAMALAPATWVAAVPAGIAATAFLNTRKFRLPFKVPMSWGGVDYGAPSLDGNGFRKASGMQYIGLDQASGEELWSENGDMRRHGFFLGTTGSGKALPLDTPVLTPMGWRLNGDLRPGDAVMHPSGDVVHIHSIHPQGTIEAARVWFSDGRFVDCSLDHLWHITTKARKHKEMPEGMLSTAEGKNITTADLGILHGVHGASLVIEVPRAAPFDGLPCSSGELGDEDLGRATVDGLDALGYMPSVVGSAKARLLFLAAFLRKKEYAYTVKAHGVRIHKVGRSDAKILKQIIWSLGGAATEFVRRDRLSGCDVQVMFDGIADIWPRARTCSFQGEGLEVIGVERLEAPVEMSCIKIDREDGLYVTENHIVTHNTEFLLGLCSQTMMWSSGFMFIDGKGTPEFYSRVFGLAKRFGREDDVRVLNFTDSGGDPDAPSGGPDVQSNTLNPFSDGGSDQLYNLVASLMGSSQKQDMWKDRALSLVSCLMRALVELRDRGDILLNVQTIRNFLHLGDSASAKKLDGKVIEEVSELPEDVMKELREHAGMIALHIRAERGEFSEATREALEGFFKTLTNYSFEKAINGKGQGEKVSEQFSYLSMQLTKALGSLADDYGHIFNTPLGEVDINDVVLNRRILVVLLPALKKAKDEMKNCGKICVSLVKIMMGNASGSKVTGKKRNLIDAKQTKSDSPYIVVMDEAGYYMVEGIDAMLAQARSLGFSCIVAGQDMAAMKGDNEQIAKTAAANASLMAAGKVTDGDDTLKFIQALFGTVKVSVTAGFSGETQLLGTRWVDRMDTSFEEAQRVTPEDLQSMVEGEFYLLFQGTLVRASTFYIGERFPLYTALNKFLKVRGPRDRVPGLDQKTEQSFENQYLATTQKLLEMHHSKRGLDIEELDDNLTVGVGVAHRALVKAKAKAGKPQFIAESWLMAVLCQDAYEAGIDRELNQYDEEQDTNPDGSIDLNSDKYQIPDINSSDNVVSDPHGVHKQRQSSQEILAAVSGNSDQSKVNSLFNQGIPDADLAESLHSIATGATVQERNRGFLDMLLVQQNAAQRAQQIPALAQQVKAAEAGPNDADARRTEIVNDFFAKLCDDSQAHQGFFAEQDVDGRLALEVLRRQDASRSLPLVAGASVFSATMRDLEAAVRSEQESE